MAMLRLRHAFLPAAIAAIAFAVLSSSGESLAAGDKPGPKKPAAAVDSGASDDMYDPENKTHISHFMETVAQANAKATSRDFAGATELYRKAIQLQPANPLGHYLLGEVQLVQNNLPEAEASMNQADNVGDKNPAVKTKVLFVLADIKERQKKWDDAKAAWTRYNEYAGNHDAGAMPASAAARIQSIDDMLKQDKTYEIVRQRILAEKDGGAAPTPAPTAPAK